MMVRWVASSRWMVILCLSLMGHLEWAGGSEEEKGYQMSGAYDPKKDLSPPLRILRNAADLVVVATVREEYLFAGFAGSSPLPEEKPQLITRMSTPLSIHIEKTLKGEAPSVANALVTVRVADILPGGAHGIPRDDGRHGYEAFLRSGETLGAFKELEKLKPGTRWIFVLWDRQLRKELGTEKLNEKEARYVAFDPFLSVLPYSAELEMEMAR